MIEVKIQKIKIRYALYFMYDGYVRIRFKIKNAYCSTKQLSLIPNFRLMTFKVKNVF